MTRRAQPRFIKDSTVMRSGCRSRLTGIALGLGVPSRGSGSRSSPVRPTPATGSSLANVGLDLLRFGEVVELAASRAI